MVVFQTKMVLNAKRMLLVLVVYCSTAALAVEVDAVGSRHEEKVIHTSIHF